MAWSQEEFERRNPRSEALRAAQAAKFLEQFRETARRIEEQKQPRQLSLDEINTAELLDSLRRPNEPKNLSIDEMKALGLYVPDYRSIPLTERPLQTQLPLYSSEVAFDQPADIPSVKRAVQQIESTPIPRSVGGNRMAGRLGKLLIPLITGTSAGVLLDDVIAANQAERMPAPIDEDEAAKLAAAELLAQAVS